MCEKKKVMNFPNLRKKYFFKKSDPVPVCLSGDAWLNEGNKSLRPGIYIFTRTHGPPKANKIKQLATP